MTRHSALLKNDPLAATTVRLTRTGAAVAGMTLAVLALACVPALAQNPQVAPPANPVAPVAPPSAGSAPPEKIAPPTATPSNRSLSNHLSRQGGVIQPPSHVDPGMTVKPPRSGASTMPVIPPPGSSGGNRSVVPK